METLLIVLLAAGVGIFHNSNKPTEYTLNMEDGSHTQIILQKNSQYACPLYCEVDHIHQAILCKNDKQNSKHQSVYHITKKGESDPAIYCSLKKILSMNKLSPNTPKDKLPDVVSASSDE
mgnify:FL=1